jgi:transcriptional regulator with XRE-family HTH domain
MLVVETIARIRREHFVKGKTIKEIARDLGISRNTIRKVLRSGETSFEYERTIQPRPKLGRWTSDLNELLEGNAAKPAREQLTLIRIFEELRVRGYDGGYDAVRRYAGRWVKDTGFLGILTSAGIAHLSCRASASRPNSVICIHTTCVAFSSAVTRRPRTNAARKATVNPCASMSASPQPFG